MNSKLTRARKTKEPCVDCGLRADLCICALRPALDLRTRLLLVVHHRELKRTTNTGRLAVQMLANSQMFVRGLGREALDLSAELSPAYRSLLFFPGEGARELNAELVAESDLPIQLIVPDGNWRQASKVGIRHPELRDLPRVMIRAVEPEAISLRKESSPEGMATLRAINAAFRVTEGERVYEIMESFYRAKLAATLEGRGLR